MTERQAGIAGIAAFAVFWIALFAFSAAHPNYSHFTKAISELGVIGAPHALAWNLIAFIVPGLLPAVCGAGLAVALAIPFLAQRPGLAQRISFAIYFLWFLVMSFYLLSTVPRVRHVLA